MPRWLSIGVAFLVPVAYIFYYASGTSPTAACFMGLACLPLLWIIASVLTILGLPPKTAIFCALTGTGIMFFSWVSVWPVRTSFRIFQGQIDEIRRQVPDGKRIVVNRWLGPIHVRFAESRGAGSVFLVTGGDPSGWTGFFYSPDGTTRGANTFSSCPLSSNWSVLEED